MFPQYAELGSFGLSSPGVTMQKEFSGMNGLRDWCEGGRGGRGDITGPRWPHTGQVQRGRHAPSPSSENACSDRAAVLQKTPLAALQLFSPWHVQSSILALPQRSAFQHRIGQFVWGQTCCGLCFNSPLFNSHELDSKLFEKQIHTCHTQAQLLTSGKNTADI